MEKFKDDLHGRSKILNRNITQEKILMTRE